MKSLADFEAFVEMYAPNAPRANLQHAIRESVIDFMTQTRAAVDILYVTVPCNEREIPLEAPECRRIIQVEALYISPHCTDSRWEPEWDQLPHSEQGGGGWWIDEIGAPNATLWLAQGFAQPSRLALQYSWTISRDNCQVPDWLYEQYADKIAAGAVYRLHSNPAEEWASAVLASTSLATFNVGVAEARQRKGTQFRARRIELSGAHFFVG